EPGPAQREGAGGRRVGEGRDDDLVARLQVQRDRAHLQGVGARGREQHRGRLDDAADERRGPLGVGTVAVELALLERVADVCPLVGRHVWFSERGRLGEHLVHRTSSISEKSMVTFPDSSAACRNTSPVPNSWYGTEKPSERNGR